VTKHKTEQQLSTFRPREKDLLKEGCRHNQNRSLGLSVLSFTMGCGSSKQDVAAANLKVIEKNLKRGKDRLGHDENFNMVPLDPNTQPMPYTGSGHSGGGFLASGFGGGAC